MSSPSDIASLVPSELLSIVAQCPIPPSQTTVYETARTTIPTTVHDHAPPSVSLSELDSILSYKLAIGVNRPFLRSMLKKNTDAQVREVSERAFAVPAIESGGWESTKDAMHILCELKGVGPALASLVLSLLYPAQIPFFSDEAGVHVLKPEGGRKGLKYTMKEYERLWQGLAEIRESINARGKGESGSEGGTVGNGDVERAIWTRVREEGVQEETKGKKRKADEGKGEGKGDTTRTTKKSRTKKK